MCLKKYIQSKVVTGIIIDEIEKLQLNIWWLWFDALPFPQMYFESWLQNLKLIPWVRFPQEFQL